jgi:hypothetical protein
MLENNVQIANNDIFKDNIQITDFVTIHEQIKTSYGVFKVVRGIGDYFKKENTMLVIAFEDGILEHLAKTPEKCFYVSCILRRRNDNIFFIKYCLKESNNDFYYKEYTQKDYKTMSKMKDKRDFEKLLSEFGI